MSVIGLATLLYKRLTGSLSLRMQAFDSWTEMTAVDVLGIPEIDQNVERARANQRVRDALRRVPRERYMHSALKYYEFFLANRNPLEAALGEAPSQGQSFQDFLDSQLKSP